MATTAVFDDEFLGALGAWQRGWREHQPRRGQLAIDLERCCRLLPDEFRAIEGPCFRKRFVSSSDIVMLFLNDFLDDGTTSWTIDRRYAEEFKEKTRGAAGEVGAVFSSSPSDGECIVSLPRLWASAEFRGAVTSYSERNGANADALLNFKDDQGEVVLATQMRLDGLVAISGKGSTFDELVNRAGIADAAADEAWRVLVERGTIPGERRFVRDEAVDRAVANVKQWLVQRLKSARIDPTGSGTIPRTARSGGPAL